MFLFQRTAVLLRTTRKNHCEIARFVHKFPKPIHERVLDKENTAEKHPAPSDPQDIFGKLQKESKHQFQKPQRFPKKKRNVIPEKYTKPLHKRTLATEEDSFEKHSVSCQPEDTFGNWAHKDHLDSSKHTVKFVKKNLNKPNVIWQQTVKEHSVHESNAGIDEPEGWTEVFGTLNEDGRTSTLK